MSCLAIGRDQPAALMTERTRARLMPRRTVGALDPAGLPTGLGRGSSFPDPIKNRRAASRSERSISGDEGEG
jgi:hypothetical protein